MFERIKQCIKQYAGRVAVGGASLVVAVSASAQATNPAAQVFTDLGDTAGVVIAAGYVLMGVILAGLLTMKIVRKVLGRST